jgi:hypothetical protein
MMFCVLCTAAQDVISKRCEMVDFYPTHEEVENYAYDIDYEILSEYTYISHTFTVYTL